MMSSKSEVAPGSVLGSALLVAGCCVGAGMLGVPVLTASTGFLPSLALFVVVWLFMATTGLLLVEVNLWFGDGAGLVTMAERTLGRAGKIFTWGLFLFLFYSVMIAYVIASGHLVAQFGLELFAVHVPSWAGSLVFTVLFGILIYAGTRQVDWFNRIVMITLIAAYAALVVMGAKHVDTELLSHAQWSHAWFIVPPMIMGFGYHNLVPSLSHYLGLNRKRLIQAILWGTFIPLMIYVVWQWLILGIVPVAAFQRSLDEGHMATQALREVVGSLWVATVADFFAFFAIVTSLLSVALSFVDFLGDGLKISRERSSGRALLCLLTLAPPFVIALAFPRIFLVALNYAGAFGAVILFGIIPALMVWVGRYHRQYGNEPIVKGGKGTLILVILFAIAVAVLQLMKELGVA